MDLGRDVLCSYNIYAWAVLRPWRDRKIFPDSHCNENCFYYKGVKYIRTVNLKRKIIFRQMYRDGYPSIFLKEVRKIK